MASAAERDPIWRYVPIAERTLPSDLSHDALRGFRRLWKSVRGALRGAAGSAAESSDRRRPSTRKLAGLLPEVDPETLVGALADALGDWPAEDATRDRVRVVVGPPGSRVGEVVAELARRRGCRQAEPPERADLVSRADSPADAATGLDETRDGPLVLPRLERWVARNERGLPRVRSLLERLRDLTTPLLIGCDSWAWSFLDRTLGVGNLLAQPLALAALDARALDDWLGGPLRAQGLACRSLGGEQQSVFAAAPDVEDGGGDEPPPVSSMLVGLASASRGNPSVARELWRRSLCLDDGEREPSGEARDGRAETIWTAPLHETEVVVPSRLESVHGFVLHAALLHGGLERDLIPDVVPFARHDLSRRVRDLATLGLLDHDDGGELSVPLAAYPAVREYLDHEGFLVDDL